ncbi:MAG: outer membrane beta-barrel protein [Akkermansiaceae bacterium]
MKKYIITGIMSAIAATSVMAGTLVASKEVVAIEDPCLFRDNELQLDAFGLGDFYRGSTNLSGRPAWGGGLGINYFFSRYVGVGLEQDLYGRNSKGNANQLNDYGYTRWATIGNLFLRYPICSWNLAPYIMVGGGANYGTSRINVGGQNINRMSGQGFGHVGGGLEYRFTENIGVFSDARYLFSGVTGLPNNQLMWRYGLRFAF